MYAPHTVARALLEGATRAWWLLDPTIDGRERVCRVLTERLASLHEAAKVAFRAWSGATHGMLWSLTASLDPQPDPTGGTS